MLIDPTPLRVSFEEGEETLTMKIGGKLARSQVNELRRGWYCAAPSLGCRHLVIDLHDLIFMDREGLAALSEICRETGAQFHADTPLTKYFVEEALSKAIGDSQVKGVV
jgi:hypothetical protein